MTSCPGLTGPSSPVRARQASAGCGVLRVDRFSHWQPPPNRTSFTQDRPQLTPHIVSDAHPLPHTGMILGGRWLVQDWTCDLDRAHEIRGVLWEVPGHPPLLAWERSRSSVLLSLGRRRNELPPPLGARRAPVPALPCVSSPLSQDRSCWFLNQPEFEFLMLVDKDTTAEPKMRFYKNMLV